VFYFTNPNALCGHRQPVAYPEGTEELDFELELAIIIAQGGKNIPKEKAESYIAGYTIMNDWSARDWQREEMQLGLGPAKGKDFATSLGPALVTPDELPPGGLTMTAHLNDREVSRGNSADLAHSFAIMIERASRNVNLRPGDVIGSGTVGTGCILELGPENTGGWLKRGDHIRLEVEGLGVLENHII
jgi:fumarylacetoacetate (FAA) hydrolase